MKYKTAEKNQWERSWFSQKIDKTDKCLFILGWRERRGNRDRQTRPTLTIMNTDHYGLGSCLNNNIQITVSRHDYSDETDTFIKKHKLQMTPKQTSHRNDAITWMFMQCFLILHPNQDKTKQKYHSSPIWTHWLKSTKHLRKKL